jgi:DNA-binding LytR/AlgR family response regulator
MLNIAICDDELKICAELEAALMDMLGKLNIEHEIEVYLTGEVLCRSMEAGMHYDLIFLDIEFAKNEISGVEVGRLIRDAHQNNVVSIVYISWEKKYSMQLFNIRPLNFLIKPLEYDEVEQVVRTYLQIAGLWSGVFTYKIGHETFKAQIKDIVYLESRDRKLMLHLADGRKEKFYGSLKKAYEEQLMRFDFLFIHASYVVNFDYVTSMKYNQLLLADSSAPLPISQNNRNAVRERYHAIMKRRRAN